MYVRTSRRRSAGLSGLGDALVDCLSAQIDAVEGYNPNFAPNNNPGNLIYVGPNQDGQSGVTRGAGGFARFQNAAAGEAAKRWQIENYIGRGFTPTDFFMTWAPPNTKNAAGGAQTALMTANYINRVSSACGLDPNIPLQQVRAGGGTTSDTPSSSSPFDFSSFIPDSLSSSTQYEIGGLVLSGSDLLLIGGIGLTAVVLFAML